MSPAERLALSERVLVGWEAQGGPHGRLADSIRMCRDEMVILETIGEEAPGLREKAAELIARYQQLATKMKLVH